jgi:tetratricopeptide (TPR) repeat protein
MCANANTNLGTALAYTGDPEGAIAAFGKTIELATTDTWVAYRLLACLRANYLDPAFRNAKEAVRLAERAVELQPDHVGPRLALGVACDRVEDWERAAEARGGVETES